MVSFAFIILITLCLSFSTLVLVSRPIQSRINRVQLVNQSRLAARQVDIFLNRGGSVAELIERISGNSLLNETHLLLVDGQSRVLADTADAWVGQVLALDSSARQVATDAARVGSFQSPDGETITFAAHTVGDTDNPIGYVMAVAPEPSGLPPIISQLGLGFITAGVISLLVSLLIGVLIARSIALPLRDISKATTAVAAGDYAHRVPENGPPEIRRVSTSFNTMAGRVEAAQAAMRDFVSNVSHELKTPLTSIKGFSQALMEGAAQDEAARRRAAEIIHEEASRMSRLVEDLLDLARIESGQIVMNEMPLDVAQILNGTIDRLLPQAVEKQLDIVRRWDTIPPVVGDGDRLAQVFTNVLDNAVRHTPAGGQIMIAARTIDPTSSRTMSDESTISPPMVQISIRDTGPGIPADDLARVFERFYQIDKSRKRGGGAGLGLAIIKEIVEAHHGYVNIQSEVGLGTTFVIALPVAAAET
ncbi:MAG: HAMP domain-containing protein [Anaerolineae bacterium]|nr:HAMP domain-containing protein [Anaerolineae bacterium]